MNVKTGLILGICLLPNFVLASVVTQCTKDGYTVATVNGVFTDDAGARVNMKALRDTLGLSYKNERLDYQYLLNDTNLAGVKDILDAANQKYFDDEVVSDYDLTEILNSASQKVTTQKLLLVAHSQGNFYANSFYDKVTASSPSPSGRAGEGPDVPPQSIGVYSVATPSSRVAGGGQWLTSDTDKVIAGIVNSTLSRTIMAPNTHIDLEFERDETGHGFATVYLKYRGAEIVSAIQKSLDKLKPNDVQAPDKKCIDPPELSLVHKVQSLVFVVADPLANLGMKTVGDSANAVITTTSAIAKGVGGALYTVASAFTIAILGKPTPIIIPIPHKETMFVTGLTPKAIVQVAPAPQPPRTLTQAETDALVRQIQSLQDRAIGLREQHAELRAMPKKPVEPAPPAVKTEAPKAELPKPTASITSVFQILSPGFGGGGTGVPIAEVKPPPSEPEPEPDPTYATSSAPLSPLAVAGDATVLLSWLSPTEVTDAPITDYEIHESTDNFSETDTTLDDGVSIATSTLVAGLTNSTAYYFKIFAINRAGTSSASDIVTATPVSPIVAPSAPQSLTATRGNASASLAWSAPADDGGELTDYEIHKSTDGFTSNDDILVDGTGTTTGYLITELANGTQYSFKVFAINNAGTSTASNVIAMIPGVVPNAPTDIYYFSYEDDAGIMHRGDRLFASPEIGSNPLTYAELRYSTEGPNGPTFLPLATEPIWGDPADDWQYIDFTHPVDVEYWVRGYMANAVGTSTATAEYEYFDPTSDSGGGSL
ncbi:MAG: fibronectin type III domain-containing protein [Candidatus Paceibacterota bacterium]|jgi:hypothetical protein